MSSFKREKNKLEERLDGCLPPDLGLTCPPVFA